MDKFPIHYSESSKISNRKALLCSKIYIERQSRSKIYTFSPSVYQRKQRNFLKYFPKYIDKLEVPVKQGSVKTKIKRIKTLGYTQHLIFSGNMPQALYENLKRVLLYNKEKYVRNYTVYDYANLAVKDIQAYKNLQSLVFTSLRENIFNPALQLCYLRKACRFVQTQFDLRHLHFNIASQEEILCISKINSCKRVLESLESFIFTVRCSTEGEDVKLLQHLLLYKNILNATTHLNILCGENQTSTEISHQLLTHCPKLRGFYFQDYRSNRESPSLLVATPIPSCLPALKNMENLSLLKVIVNKTWPFLRDFTFLPSIQDVQLEFLPFKKSMFAGKESLPPIFTDFCEKFNNANLKNLKVLFNQTIETCDLLIPFLQQWLKKISSLQTLNIQLTPQKDSKVIKLPLMKKLDFSLFLDSIKHLGSSLESLSITDGQLFYKMEVPSGEILAFPSLQKLILNAFLPQGPQINKLFESHLLNSITLESEKPLDITLRELKFDSMDTFMSFVGLFDKANFVKRTLTIDVHAEIKVLPRAVDFSYSQTYVKEFRLYSKNVSIKLKVQTKERFLDDDESRSEFTKLLQVLKFEEKPVPLFNYYRVIYL